MKNSLEKMDIVEKLGNIKRMYVLAGLIILLALPTLVPIGLPLEISKETEALYDYIEQLPPDSVVVMHSILIPVIFPELKAQSIVVTSHLFSLPVKILFISYDFLAMGQELMVKNVLPYVDKKDKIYGTDWVVLPWLPGQETGMAGLAADLHAMVSEDYYGTSLEDLPMMEQIQGAKDFDLVLDISGGHTTKVINQFHVPYDVAIGVLSQSGPYPQNVPYLKAGMIVGLLNGVRGGAEYESISKQPGEAISFMDSISLGFVGIITLIIVQNVSQIYTKKRKGRVS